MPSSDPLRFVVDGTDREVHVQPEVPLLQVLRNDLGLRGVRTGCTIGECGACRVHVDGEAVASCLTPVGEVVDRDVTTPAGLGGPDDPHPVQQAFLDEQAAQCGYCVNGMIMSVAARVAQAPVPDVDALREVLDEHICRCGTHHRLLRAAARAAGVDPAPDGGVRCARPPEASHPVAPPPIVDHEPDVTRWLEVEPGDVVVAHPGKVELGQGLRTALTQVVASQLGIETTHVRIATTSTTRSPDQGQTSGSFSIEHAGTALGMAAVALRRELLARAATRLDVPVDRLAVRTDATIEADGHVVGFHELVADAPLRTRITADDHPAWDRAPLGEPVAREDLRRKLTGAAAYVQDLAPDGMLHARAMLPPAEDAVLDDLDTSSAESLPGVVTVVRHGRVALAVAEREDQAIRAAARLRADARWHVPASRPLHDAPALLRDLEGETYVREHGDGVAEALATPTHTATYTRPYQAHGPVAPSAAVATADADHVDVTCHSQGIHPLRRELAALLDLPEDAVDVRHEDGPGCYGFTCSDDAAAFAVIAARAVAGRPVRFQFTVDQEFAWDPHGPAMSSELAARLDDGRVTAWRHRGVSDTHSTRPNGDGDRLMAAWLGPDGGPRPWVGWGEPGLRNALPPYRLGAVEVVSSEVRGPVRTGPLRSLGAFHNVFAVESFMDELAELAGRDPVAFRLDHLDDPRARDVLEAVAAHVGWESRVGPSGRGAGVSVARYKDTKGYGAVVAEVAVDPEHGSIRVERITIACDVGTVVNADGLRNQLEGGVLQGLSRTMHERLTPDGTTVVEQDWTSYGTLRFRDVPHVEVVLLDRPGAPPLGAGEVATPLVPAAIANAVDDAVGIRMRELPIGSQALQQRLLEMGEEEAQRVLV